MSVNKEQFQKKLGERIAEMREKLGFSQTDLGYKCEKDRQSINRLEKGNVNPSAYYLYQISEALGCSLGELIDFEE